MTSHRWWMASLLVVLLGHPLAALSATHVILIERMAFHRVQPSTLAVGDTIEWRNQDVVPHTATLASGAIDARMAPGPRPRFRAGHTTANSVGNPCAASCAAPASP